MVQYVLLLRVRGAEKGIVEEVMILITESIWPFILAIINTKIITPIAHTSVRGARYEP